MKNCCFLAKMQYDADMLSNVIQMHTKCIETNCNSQIYVERFVSEPHSLVNVLSQITTDFDIRKMKDSNTLYYYAGNAFQKAQCG